MNKDSINNKKSSEDTWDIAQQEKKKKHFKFWRNAKTSTKAQIVLAIFQAFTLIAFIIVGVYQISQTNDTLKLTRQSFDSLRVFNDSSLANTKRALRNSDAHAQKSLSIAESTLSVQNNSFLFANAPNFTIRAKVIPIKPIGETTYQAQIYLINIGKTQAINLYGTVNFSFETGTIQNHSPVVESAEIPDCVVYANDTVKVTVGLWNDWLSFNISVEIWYYDIYGYFYDQSIQATLSHRGGNIIFPPNGNTYTRKKEIAKKK